jgi:hypothetical protein
MLNRCRNVIYHVPFHRLNRGGVLLRNLIYVDFCTGEFDAGYLESIPAANRYLRDFQQASVAELKALFVHVLFGYGLSKSGYDRNDHSHHDFNYKSVP